MPNRMIPDVMAECLKHDEITSIDIFQGLYYLANQQMLDSSVLIGTHFEPSRIKEISHKLGQYMFVLMAQKMNFSSQKPQDIMLANAKVVQAALIEYDKRVSSIFAWVCKQVVLK